MASHSEDPFSPLLAHLCLVIHLRETHSSPGVRYEERDILACSTSLSALSESLSPGVDLSSMEDPGTQLGHLVGSVQNLRPRLPGSRELFGRHDLNRLEPNPIGGDGFAEVRVGERIDGTGIIIKSFRCDSSSSYLLTFLVSACVTYPLVIPLNEEFPQRLYKEALVSSYLNDIDGDNFVPLLGIYSTPQHPFSIVFKSMDHGNLRDYLASNQDAPKVELVCSRVRMSAFRHPDVSKPALAGGSRPEDHAQPWHHPWKYQSRPSFLVFHLFRAFTFL